LQVLQPDAIELQPGGVSASQPSRHVSFEHAPTRQLTSHAHDVPHDRSPLHELRPVQSTPHIPGPHTTLLPHEPGPVQPILQLPRPQLTVLQLWRPLHVTVHDVAPKQLTPLLQLFWPPHSTLQLQPLGHSTSESQSPLPGQSIVQVFCAVLHDVHSDGHTDASGNCGASGGTSLERTHRLSMQIRPSRQSFWVWQAKSELRWLTAHAARPQMAEMAATATAVIHGTSFTAGLRS
jgi:hypothetical protein